MNRINDAGNARRILNLSEAAQSRFVTTGRNMKLSVGRSGVWFFVSGIDEAIAGHCRAILVLRDEVLTQDESQIRVRGAANEERREGSADKAGGHFDALGSPPGRTMDAHTAHRRPIPSFPHGHALVHFRILS